MVAPSTERYVTMFLEDASLAEMDRWLRDLKYKALEGNDPAKRKLETVIELLRDAFMPNEITIDHVDSDGLWLVDRNTILLSQAFNLQNTRSSPIVDKRAEHSRLKAKQRAGVLSVSEQEDLSSLDYFINHNEE